MAVLLNTQVAVLGGVDVHDDAEKTLLAIGRSPGVTDNPVRGLRGVSGVVVVTDNGDNVVGQDVRVALRVDTTSVSLKTVSGHDGARDGSTVGDLRLDLIDTTGLSVVTDLVLGVVSDVVAVVVSGVAGTAGVELVAGLVLGLVVVASFVNETVVVGVLPDTEIVTTVAGSSVTAVNDLLDGHVGGGEGTTTSDVDTVSKSRGDTMGPARTTVLGDVLVTDGGEVVPSVHVSPVNGDGEILVLLLPGEGTGDVLTPGGVSTELLIGDESVEVLAGALKKKKEKKRKSQKSRIIIITIIKV